MSVLQELNYFGNTMSLLVVEDEKELNNELVSMLEIFFKSVDFAYNGKEGLEKYKTHRYDIILTDITMPKMDGIMMSKEIKRLNQDQSIIVLSAHGDIKYMIELIDIKVDQFILKPFDKNTLFYKLLKVTEEITYKKEFEVFYKEKKRNRLLSKVTISNDEFDQSQAIVENDKEPIVLESTEIKQEDDNYHFSHKKEHADDFMNELQNDNLIWETFKDDIPELIQLSEEFKEDIDAMNLEDLHENTRDSMAQTIHSYIIIFSTLDQMVRMTEVLEQLARFLEELDVVNLTEIQQKKLKVLEFIYEDLNRFIQTVFIYQDTVDIYYLEDSLESSITQMKNDVLGLNSNDEDDDDELELF